MKRILSKKVFRLLNRLSLRKPVFSSKKNFSLLISWLVLASLMALVSGSCLKKANLQTRPKMKKVSVGESFSSQKNNSEPEGEFFISQIPSTFQSSISEEGFQKSDSLLINRDSIVYLASFGAGAGLYGQSSIFSYVVRRGDTLSSIARRFNISLTTILSANHLKNNSIIRPGMKLTVLPVTGILYRVQENENLESISNKFRIPLKDLIKFNHLKDEKVSPGQVLVIPGIIERIKSFSRKREESYKDLPSLRGYFSSPCKGWNQGVLHKNNAVDISNLCGTPIKAAQEGLVIKAKTGWNNGYGNFIEIQHPNGTRTLYAYLESLLVREGDYVKRGQVIGKMGNSGQKEAAQSCHLHFEVHGAKNFLAE